MKNLHKTLLLMPLLSLEQVVSHSGQSVSFSVLPTVAFDGLQVNHVTFEEVDTEIYCIDNPNPGWYRYRRLF